jgi:hypothetical protein
VGAPFAVFGISFLLAGGKGNLFDLPSREKKVLEGFHVLAPMHFSESVCLAKGAIRVNELLVHRKCPVNERLAASVSL